MQTITLQYLEHRDQQRIAIYFDRDAALEKLLRSIQGIRWSHTFKCWHLPLHRDCYHQVMHLLQGKAIINSKPLLQHFKKTGINSAEMFSDIMAIRQMGIVRVNKMRHSGDMEIKKGLCLKSK